MTRSSRQNDPLHPETLAVQGTHPLDPETGAIVPPVHPSTTFARDAHYDLRGRTSYARDHNPTYEGVEDLLAHLEGGERALLFASGMASAAAVVQSLRPGDHVIALKVMYWGLRNWLIQFCADWGLELTLVDGDPDSLRAAIRPGQTKLVWIESPCNPLWQVVDIAAAAEIAHAAGARLAVDSTAATPVLTQPIALGADLVMHSATKYLNGHSDVVAGALVTARADDFWARIERNRKDLGAVLGSFEAWLLQRGLRTLFLRVRRSSDTALKLAVHLAGHLRVSEVLYPGLPGHPGHAIAQRQMQGGFGGMLSIRVTGGFEAAQQVATGCRRFLPATSLGGVESLIEHRAAIEGPDSPIPPDLLRISVGIEHPDDLLLDLDRALESPA
jgi:cystathionine gamma-synthase